MERRRHAAERRAGAATDVQRDLVSYGTELLPDDRKPIPEADMPVGMPAWMRSLKQWATRKGDTPEAKRATIEIKVPAGGRTDQTARACTALRRVLCRARPAAAPTSASRPTPPHAAGAGAMTQNAIPIRIRVRRLALLRLDPLDLFGAWMQAEHDASITLARWRDAEDGAKGDAHAAYLAALHREAHAADVLRRRVELG
jgi:hypothetical protein